VPCDTASGLASIAVSTDDCRETASGATGIEVRTNAVLELACPSSSHLLSRKRSWSRLVHLLVIRNGDPAKTLCEVIKRRLGRPRVNRGDGTLLKSLPFNCLWKSTNCLAPQGGRQPVLIHKQLSKVKGDTFRLRQAKSSVLMLPWLRIEVDASTLTPSEDINKFLFKANAPAPLRFLNCGERCPPLEKEYTTTVRVRIRGRGVRAAAVNSRKRFPINRRLGADADGCLRTGSEGPRTLTIGVDKVVSWVTNWHVVRRTRSAPLTSSNNLHFGLF